MKLLQWCFPTFFRLYEWWRDSLTPAGRVLTGAMLLSVPSLYQSTGYLPELCAVGIALLVLTKLVSAYFRPRLETRVATTAAVHAGQSIPLTITLTNRHWLPTYDTQVSLERQPRRWQVSQVVHSLPEIDCNESVSLVWQVTALQRGVHAWPRLQLENRFPFHLMRRLSWSSLAGELVVYPHRVAGDQPLWNQIMAPLVGQELATYDRAGTDGEFLGNRDYVVGMRVRRWDHRRWARLGKPIVREYDDPRRTSVVLVVDNQSNQNIHRDYAHEMVEATLTLAATMQEVCQNFDVPITQLWLAGQEPLVSCEEMLPDRMILEALARATVVRESPLAAWKDNFAKDILDESEHVLMLFGSWDASRQAFCNQLEELGVWWSAIVLVEEKQLLATDALPIWTLPRSEFLPPENHA